MTYLGDSIGKKVALATLSEQQGNREKAAQTWQEAAEMMQVFAIDALSDNSKTRRLAKAREYAQNARSLATKASDQSTVQPQTGRTTPAGEENHDNNPYRKEVRGLKFSSGIHWDDIGGLDEVRDELESFFGIFLAQKPEGVVIDSFRNIMLYGPPGTGKTMIAAAISNQLDAVFFNVKASDLTSKYFGESSKLVNALYDEARSAADTGLSIIFIDEFDSLCRAREGDTSGAEQRILSTILSELDGLAEKGEDKGVLTIAATNRPDTLDQAIRSRFQKQFYIPLPGEQARTDILKKIITKSGMTAGFDVENLSSETKGFSGRDLQGIFRGAMARMVARNNTAIKDLIRQGKQAVEKYTLKVSALLERDFLEEIEKIKIDPETTKKNNDFYARYRG
ncbi:ATP-binding protein [Desulfobacter latus]|uniref:ATP-binding protein n=1 Tax=Desulfobacter latus TaxID=2292 RepID=A0A850STZ1_9BACT|nr:ATP-binding protein [Desulfobacter latus]NWH04824.1 ATP-binding protein [Desulfobacter latus]